MGKWAEPQFFQLLLEKSLPTFVFKSGRKVGKWAENRVFSWNFSRQNRAKVGGTLIKPGNCPLLIWKLGRRIALNLASWPEQKTRRVPGDKAAGKVYSSNVVESNASRFLSGDLSKPHDMRNITAQILFSVTHLRCTLPLLQSRSASCTPHHNHQSHPPDPPENSRAYERDPGNSLQEFRRDWQPQQV